MYMEDNLDVFNRSIEMINKEYLNFIDYKDIAELILNLGKKGKLKLSKWLPPIAIFNNMQVLPAIKGLGLTNDDYLTIFDGFTFWGDYETPLALITKNNLCEKEILIKGFCLFGQKKYRQAISEFLKISKFFPEQTWKYIFVCAFVLEDEVYLQKSLDNLQKIYPHDIYLVFCDLALFKEKPTIRSGNYLSYCWQMMFCFLQLNINELFKIAFTLAKEIDKEKTIYAVIFSYWSAGKEIAPYLSMIEGNRNWKYLNIIKADNFIKQGKSLEAWHYFKIAQAYFPEDIFIINGIAFAALMEGEKTGKEALEFFSMSDLIQERVQFVEREKAYIKKRYRFLVMLKKKERIVLKRLIFDLL